MYTDEKFWIFIPLKFQLFYYELPFIHKFWSRLELWVIFFIILNIYLNLPTPTVHLTFNV